MAGGLLMSLYTEHLDAFVRQMRAEQLPDIVIHNFSHYYRKLWDGETGFIPENEIQPVTAIDDAEALPSRLKRIGEGKIHKTAFIKLNGGLGTSMGMKGAKSMLKVKSSLSFMDIIVRQAHFAHNRMPLIFMNSFSTHKDTLNSLKKYSDIWSDIPVDFLQHKIPKVNAQDLSPVLWPDDPQHEWCPPGHGDIYTALLTSGMLDRLLDVGYEYAFVSNSDNLGAVVEPVLLGYFIDNRLSFMMEVADRTDQDRKGGHLAQYKNGRYLLREVAQCPDEDLDAFQDIERHRYFNTNNIWLYLPDLKAAMERTEGLLNLPMICNQKTVDPRDSRSTPVIQLETAMGAAISAFYASGAIRVPRTRFVPVKSTNDLLALRSDLYTLDKHYRVAPSPERRYNHFDIDLDLDYYKKIDNFERRFAFGPPSLVECNSLKVRGDFRFGTDVKLEGGVKLLNERDMPFVINDQARIEGELRV
jgi:UTP--glucose-1-phosphate uridylyltransferase